MKSERICAFTSTVISLNKQLCVCVCVCEFGPCSYSSDLRSVGTKFALAVKDTKYNSKQFSQLEFFFRAVVLKDK